MTCWNPLEDYQKRVLLDQWSPTNIRCKLIWNSHLETPLFHDHKRYLAPKLVHHCRTVTAGCNQHLYFRPYHVQFFQEMKFHQLERYELWYLKGTLVLEINVKLTSYPYFTLPLDSSASVAISFWWNSLHSLLIDGWKEGGEKWIWIFPISYLDDRMKESDTRFSLKGTLKSLCSLRIFNFS